MTDHAVIERPSPWVERFAPLIPRGEVLDLACGGGRHARFLAALGYPVLAVDRDDAMLERASGAGIRTKHFDFEEANGETGCWPFAAGQFAGIVVTNYLHRPLFPFILSSLINGGVLIYETFAVGNERFGKPSNHRFLLRQGELLDAVLTGSEQPCRVIAYEHGYVEHPKPALIQRICAVAGAASDLEGRLYRI